MREQFSFIVDANVTAGSIGMVFCGDVRSPHNAPAAEHTQAEHCPGTKPSERRDGLREIDNRLHSPLRNCSFPAAFCPGDCQCEERVENKIDKVRLHRTRELSLSTFAYVRKTNVFRTLGPRLAPKPETAAFVSGKCVLKSIVHKTVLL